MAPRPVLTVEEFYAHALAIEREAARCYGEFEVFFTDRGDDVLAGLCRNLAQLENEHFELLVKSSAGMGIPAIDAGSHLEWVAHTTPDGAVRSLARAMAQEEMEHVHWVQNALEYSSSPPIDREPEREREPLAQ